MQMTAYTEEVMTEMGAHLSPEDRVLLHELRRRTNNEFAATLSASSHRLRRRVLTKRALKLL